MRDGRFWRLQGRWDLEYDHRPSKAINALSRALIDFPQDWRIHYRLARALRIANQPEEAQREAECVARIRELLDPLTLKPLLSTAFARLPEPAAIETLSDLCTRTGLTRLADSWRMTSSQSVQREP
jgi:hypothetical protein